jgi:hypothetical protein
LRIMCGGRSELKRNEEFEIIFTIQKKMNWTPPHSPSCLF